MKALVLCAGYGTRLRYLTHNTPKPMLPLSGKPLLAWTLRYLASYGFSDIAINLHYRPEAIKTYFGDGKSLGVNLHYSHERTLLGTAGAVKKLEHFFSDVDDFLVLYGDLLSDQDLYSLVQFHRGRKALASVVLHRRLGSNSVVRMDGEGLITSFLEKPHTADHPSDSETWVNSGIQILDRKIFQFIPENVVCDLPRDIYVPLVGKEKLFGFPLSGYRCAIDAPERYFEAQAAITSGLYRPALPVQSGTAPLIEVVKRTRGESLQ